MGGGKSPNINIFKMILGAAGGDYIMFLPIPGLNNIVCRAVVRACIFILQQYNITTTYKIPSHLLLNRYFSCIIIWDIIPINSNLNVTYCF